MAHSFIENVGADAGDDNGLGDWFDLIDRLAPFWADVAGLFEEPLEHVDPLADVEVD
jgi:hypothetical protein